MFVEIWFQFLIPSGAEVCNFGSFLQKTHTCKFCRFRLELSNEYLLAKNRRRYSRERASQSLEKNSIHCSFASLGTRSESWSPRSSSWSRGTRRSTSRAWPSTPPTRAAASSRAWARSEVNIELNFPPKLRGARSRLYRRRFLQVNTRWKALAEIYTMHSFAPFSNLNFFVKNRQNFFAIELMNIH